MAGKRKSNRRDARRTVEGRFRQEIERRKGSFEFRVTPGTGAGVGGSMVPPLWLEKASVIAPLAGRPIGNLATQIPLPKGTHQVNLPRITTSPTVAVQATEGSATSGTDLLDAVSTSTVVTIAGHEDVALQLLEQSPGVSFDSIMMRSLTASYNNGLENELVNGSGAGGHLRGVLNVTGLNSVTFTSGAPTVPLFWTLLSQALSQLARNRQRAPECVYMHPTRWFWIAGALDSQNRPMFPPGTGPMPPPGTEAGDSTPVGPLLNVPTYFNTSVPTTQGAGSNQDVVLALRPSDLLLFEGESYVSVLPEVLSGTLQVRFEFHRYVAFHADLYPTSIATVTGTGLTSPSGY